MNINKRIDQLLDRYILYNTAGNVYWKDRDGIYRGCNYNMAKLFKLSSPEDIIGKTDFDFFLDKYHVRKIIENDRLVITSGKEILIEEIGADENGKLLCFYTKKIPLYDQKKNIVGVMGTSIDITAQKEAEAREISAIKKTIEQEKETEALREKVATMQMLGGDLTPKQRTLY